MPTRSPLPTVRRALAAAAITLAALPGLSVGAGFDRLVVFGDSLSDSGNNAIVFNQLTGGAFPLTGIPQSFAGNFYVPAQPYAPAGTYSNGPVWATQFASLLGVPLAPSLAGGTNFAFGGATTGTNGAGVPLPGGGTALPGFPNSLKTQVQSFLASPGNSAPANASSLFVVAGGGNNARAALEAALADPGNAPSIFAATAQSFAADVVGMVGQLRAAGAQNIVVWNAPNLGAAPGVLNLGPTVAGTAAFLGAQMNIALIQAAPALGAVEIFDIYGLVGALASDPGNGILNFTGSCGATDATAACGVSAFYDAIHPTTLAHAAVASALFAAVIPEPQTYALMAFGLVAVAFVARRQRRATASTPAAA